MTKGIHDHVHALEQMRPKLAQLFPNYIFHIRFPRFKNMTPGARLDFTFPLTALVGTNGSGKTSVLYSLYGAPLRYSTGDYWFGTVVDPIIEGAGSPSRFIYGHYNSDAKAIVETRKARVRKVRGGKPDPNYWEPTKEVSSDGMVTPSFSGALPRGRSRDRWNPVERPVLYINFRSELSAFDKYWYFGRDPGGKRVTTKKDLVVRDAKTLSRVIASNSTTLTRRGQKIASENRLLSKAELKAISYILGREYDEARLLQHRLFRGMEGLSVIFKTTHARYSEAFAGSGEVAVTSCVVQVLGAAPGTLVLLDEPEVSLHPGAQERLLEFLLENCKTKKIQVVLSTHAPSMVGGLPEDAIKAFTSDASGSFSVIPSTQAYSAFRRLGIREGGQIRVVTEDRLAKSVVDLALLNLDDVDRSRFSVDFVPGGADAILKYRIPALMEGIDDVFVYLDGDKRKHPTVVDPDDIPVARDHELQEIIGRVFGVEPLLLADGSDGVADKAKLIQLQRRFLRYAKDHVRYLPCSCPEEVVLRALGLPATATSLEAKTILRAKAEGSLGKGIPSEKVDSYGEFALAEKRTSSNELANLAQELKQVAAMVKPK